MRAEKTVGDRFDAVSAHVQACAGPLKARTRHTDAAYADSVNKKMCAVRLSVRRRTRGRDCLSGFWRATTHCSDAGSETHPQPALVPAAPRKQPRPSLQCDVRPSTSIVPTLDRRRTHIAPHNPPHSLYDLRAEMLDGHSAQFGFRAVQNERPRKREDATCGSTLFVGRSSSSPARSYRVVSTV